MMTAKKTSHGSLRLSLTGVLAAFAFAGTVEAQALRKVRIAIPSVATTSTSVYVTKENGYWREEGLDVELVLMRAAIGPTAVTSGNVEFVTLGGGGLLAILRGLPLRVTFATFNRPDYALYAKADIRSIQDLKGKRLGVSSIGSGPDSLVRDLLKKRMADGGKDVTIMAVGAGDERVMALRRGIVDAAILTSMEEAQLADFGLRELYSFVKQTDYADVPNSLIAREELIKSDPVLLERVIRGNLKGLLYFRENRAGTAKILSRTLKVNEQFAGRLYDAIRPSTTTDGTATEEQQRGALEHLLERAGVKETPPLEKVFDFSMTRKVFKELEAKRWKP
jgi:NitT/TauT family transport system substrate-binding protein